MRVTLLLFAVAVVAPNQARGEDLPRRMLVVHVGNPLYLNTLTSKARDGPDRVRDASDRLAEVLRVPTGKANNQLVILSDTLPAQSDRIATRAGIIALVRSFCETSRAQDRVLLYFAGHVFEKDGKAFFAPLEGDPNDFSTLVPVAELYEMLKKCRATQAVVVWDVCRRNPTRPRLRPDSPVMTEPLAKALSAAPPGVQVVLPCAPGEFALEYSEPKGDARLFAGSALHDAFRQAIEDRAVRKKPDPNDPIPVAEVFAEIERYVASAAKAYGVKQTPKLVGKQPAQLVALDPKEEPAVYPKGLSAVAQVPRAELETILNELDLPPILGGDALRLADLNLATLVTRDALKPYEPDVSIDDILKNAAKYKLRVAVLRALQTIRDTSLPADPCAAKPPTAIAAPITERSKKAVLDAQGPIALALAKLEGELEALTLLADLRDKEPKRWRAHYDYALAQVRLRLAVLNEYNLALGHVRTETLPELSDGSRGWQLAFVEKMQSKKPIRDLAAAATEGFKTLAAENKGTPWEILAKRALLTPPGLKWEPIGKQDSEVSTNCFDLRHHAHRFALFSIVSAGYDHSDSRFLARNRTFRPTPAHPPISTTDRRACNFRCFCTVKSMSVAIAILFSRDSQTFAATKDDQSDLELTYQSAAHPRLLVL